jgi:isoleucyl-tRNA synthetase
VKYKEYKNLNYAQVADEVLKFWKENKIFEASVEVREGAPSFTFYEGPPSANGTPGIHHVMARSIKDIFCRYKTLKGFQVKRKGGWDTHGLPVELQVEKELGITKEDIGKTISVEEYNARCRETVMKFTDQWNSLTEKMGYWVDLDEPYVTYENRYIESLWNLLKKLYDKGLLYKGYTIQPYSPGAGTGLSSHELNMPGTYKDVKDTTIVAMFEVKRTYKSEFLFGYGSNLGFNSLNPNKNDIYILAWTTTPWTLPANSALTVGKNITYALVRTFNPYTLKPINVILAKDLISKYFSEAEFSDYLSGVTQHLNDYLKFWLLEGNSIINQELQKPNSSVKNELEVLLKKNRIPYKILPEFKGKDLEGVEYEQLLPYVQPDRPAFRVILGDFVTTEDGTGVVHTSPTFGADDFRVAQANGIPAIMVQDETGKEVPIVDRTGRFVKEIGEFGGRFVKPEYYSAEEQADPEFKATDVLIAIKLKEEGKAFKVEKYEHTYPHCWRTDKPVLYYPLDSWFIRTTAMKDRLVELNKTINWKPESTGTGRFGNWLENLVDWNLSRSRYWGTPLPIWRSEDGEEICIGSVDELSQEIEKSIAAGYMETNPVKKKPHPQPLSGGEGSNAGNIGGEGSIGNVEKYVFTADKKKWFSSLKEFARSNRKNQTEAETVLWETIRNNKLGSKFRRQHAIDEFIADFVCIPARLVVEVDGAIHDLPDYKTYDQTRTEYLEALGYQVLRFSNEDVVQHLNRVVAQIQETIKERLYQQDKMISAQENQEAPSPREKGLGDEASFDLHRPYVDRIVLVSSTGKPMFREPDLIDVWFDSGAMPYAQWHYPFENGDIFNESYPADFISEGVDQTRGWFFTLHAIAGMLFDSVAFKNVVSTGLVLDKNGNKMSKRLGNAVDPFETLAKYGPDATRWYMITNAEPWDNLRFNLDGVVEAQRKFFGTLFNTYNFFALYANLDGYQFDPANRVPHEKLPELDRWILSKLNTLIGEVAGQLDDYNPTKAGRLVQDFVTDQLSNWYVRLNRRRFWKGELSEDKRAAYETLQQCLVTVAQLMSPIAPFFGEWLYKNLTDSLREGGANAGAYDQTSVHLTRWFEVQENLVDPDLEESMQLAQEISSLVHSLRKGNNAAGGRPIKVRQPLSRVLVPVLNEKTRRQIEAVVPIILSEVNVKAVEFIDDDSGILKKKIKPNFKALGPHFGPKMKDVAAAIQAMTEADIKQIEKEGTMDLSVREEIVSIQLSDVEIIAEDVPGWLVASEGGLTVALDVTITDELRREGIARDFVNRIQNLRKDKGFEVTDKIQIRLLNNDDLLADAISTNKSYICQEVQATGLDLTTDLNGEAVEIEMDEFLLKVKVEVV